MRRKTKDVDYPMILPVKVNNGKIDVYDADSFELINSPAVKRSSEGKSGIIRSVYTSPVG